MSLGEKGMYTITNLHPAFSLLCYNFEAKDTVLSQVHVSLYRVKMSGNFPEPDRCFRLTKKSSTAATSMHGLALEI